MRRSWWPGSHWVQDPEYPAENEEEAADAAAPDGELEGGEEEP